MDGMRRFQVTKNVVSQSGYPDYDVGILMKQPIRATCSARVSRANQTFINFLFLLHSFVLLVSALNTDRGTPNIQ